MRKNPIVAQIPDSLPDYTAPIYTPKEEQVPVISDRDDWYDEPDYTQVVAQGINEVLNERPQLTRSEAEEQMHLAELRRLAEGYTENDAVVISQVLAKKYPWVMFTALNDEYFSMKMLVDTVTGAVKQNEEQ